MSIASDGWSNLKNQQLINTMAVSGGRAVFVNGHDVSGIEKTGLNIAEFIFKAIDFVGPSNVVQVVAFLFISIIDQFFFILISNSEQVLHTCCRLSLIMHPIARLQGQ